jgi:hypothetical protein
MFPIPSGRNLSFIEIGKYWSRDGSSFASSEELRITLSKAWWRGELAAENGPSRLNLLRAIYSTCQDFIAFIIPEKTEPPRTRLLDDGVVEVFRRVRVAIPNSDYDTWTEADCAKAFEVIADAWDEELFHLTAPLVMGVVLTQDEFNQWITEFKYGRPTFWSNARQQTTNDTVRHERTKPVKYQIQKAVEALAKQHGGKFPPDGMPAANLGRPCARVRVYASSLDAIGCPGQDTGCTPAVRGQRTMVIRRACIPTLVESIRAEG